MALKAKIDKQLLGLVTGEVIEREFTVRGIKYVLRNLKPFELQWVNGKTAGVSDFQAAMARRTALLAVSLVSLNGVHVRDFVKFQDDMPESERITLEKNDALLSAWRREQLYELMAGDDGIFPEPVLNELGSCYYEVAGEEVKALEKLGPLSTRTGNSLSSATFLPEKVSSPATQPSPK